MYVFVIGIYAGVQLLFSLLMRIPACHSLTNSCDRWAVVRFFKWMHQERYYLGRGMYERINDYIKYMVFWVVVLGCKFAFAYFLQIEPLVKPTRIIANLSVLEYSWHDLVSKSKFEAFYFTYSRTQVLLRFYVRLHCDVRFLMLIWRHKMIKQLRRQITTML